MQSNTTQFPFLGPCTVCGKINLNYNALSNHYRHLIDPAHLDLKEKWNEWRATYKATLRCRKCGGLFEITEKKKKDCKRCPNCEILRKTMSKRKYEALKVEKQQDTRIANGATGSKASWPVGYAPMVTWAIGCPLYLKIQQDIESGLGVRDIMQAHGLNFKVVNPICIAILGADNHAAWIQSTRAKTIHKNREQARMDSRLEHVFIDQIQQCGLVIVARNSWSTLNINGQELHREVDIKLAVGDGRKVLIFCDGEVFHGPKCLYANPNEKIASDRETAIAFFNLGYSAVRYSESEIHNGKALQHLIKMWNQLKNCSRVYRSWCPNEEICVVI